MNRKRLREIIAEEHQKYLFETLTKKDFIMMAREIRKVNPQYREVLTKFAIILGKSQNPQFKEDRFRQAVETGRGI
jgi:hypothetical protein